VRQVAYLQGKNIVFVYFNCCGLDGNFEDKWLGRKVNNHSLNINQLNVQNLVL